MRVLNRFYPEGIWRIHGQLCKRLGINSPIFILSFDCDTRNDANVVTSVASRLRERGVSPIFAVPGALIEAAWDSYAALANQGFSFINHGFREHSSFDALTGKYQSTYFYSLNRMNEITEDIERGHEVLLKLTGKRPNAFRTPHFGEFSQPEDLKFLYRSLRTLDYKISSSTTPSHGLLHGPLLLSDGIWEIPVSGTFHHPLTILDTWSFRFSGAGDRRQEYEESLKATYRYLLKSGAPALINIYGDPSHVHDWDGFFESVALFAEFNCDSYESLFKKLDKRS
jgi:hypothetical protein